jgi:hypothetical protein
VNLGRFRRFFRRPPTSPDYRRAGLSARDPYAGIVNGPQLVERTRWTREQHHARWNGDDAA